MRSLVSGALGVAEFEVLFLSRYKNDPELWPRPVFNVLESAFGALDEFVEDPDLRAQVQGIGADEVLVNVQRALSKLVDLKSAEELESDG